MSRHLWNLRNLWMPYAVDWQRHGLPGAGGGYGLPQGSASSGRNSAIAMPDSPATE